ncbi:hypothetical protein GOHSU_27_00770 [Gordonia hirsuta DSM 44140 = NBRC 16056]|uniref:Novel STAND NTPase 1 domain-containing protein n=1 Tax=Gordonia hirsuta DSM 44140 = NBRC 16056 TaxID=1121927 RepID=L7LB27_9ACTN|nr:AAA family ATPase [Gordonia hirsuta]GAC57941.1 hypothetical protein GOHSU_27_00770 [Gordonia hirsuta DSM 44140 = NBRC 16056]
MTFSTELRGLWSAAGDPTLKKVAEAVAERGHAAGITVPRSFLARLSDWRNGRHLPREFDGVLLLTVAELLDRARARGDLGDVPGRMEQWEALWRQERLDAAEREIASPYPGLAAYGPDAADRFFGRDRQIAAVTALVDDAFAAGGGLVALVGVSGSGKSSLLAAGVCPQMRARGVRVVAVTPGTAPQRELAQALAREGAEHPDGPTLIVIDQAEELFTVADRTQTTSFLADLADRTAPDAVTPDGTTPGGAHPTVVLLGLRADFLAEWVTYPQLLEAMNERTYLLGPMTREELGEVITRPAQSVGVRLDPGLEERILAEFGGPHLEDYDAGALPLLNHALATLWGHRTGNRLTLAALDGAGGVFGALDETAEQLWSGMTGAVQREAKRLLLRLVHVDETGRRTRMLRTRADLLHGDQAQRAARESALDALLNARLLMIDGEDRISFTHEILMRAWRRLRDWIEENRADLLARQQLEAAAEAWADADRDRSLLMRGASLQRARQAASTGEVSAEATAFVAAADRGEFRAARRRRIGVGALALATVVGLLLSVIAYQSRTEAVHQRTTAELSRLLAEADRLRASDPTAAARLTQLVMQQDPSAVNQSRLVATGNLPLAVSVQTGGGAVYTVDISPDGSRVAGTGSDGAARIWQLDRPDARPQVLSGHSSFVTGVFWSPDGAALATTSDDGTARIWPQPGSDRTPTTLRGHDGRVVYAAWAPDGRRLATAGMDGTVRVWDTASGRELAQLTGHGQDVRAVAWSPDGSLIASGGADRTARLWDAEAYTPRGVIDGYRDTVHALDFRPDGQILATGSDDTSVQLWDVRDPARPARIGIPITAHTAPVWSVAFAPDGRELVTASLDGTARVWSVAQPQVPVQLGGTLDGAGSSLFSVAFAPDGRRVATSGADGRILLWDLPGTVLPGHTGRVIAPAVVGRTMVTAGSGGTVLLWDLADRTRPRLLADTHTAGNARIDQVSLSADGGLVAAATAANTVQVWPVTEGRFGKAVELTVDTLDQQRAVFAPTGSLLLTGARDDSFQLWRVAPSGEARPIGPPLIHGDPGSWATAAAWSPDGRRVVTGGADGQLVIWAVDPSSGARRLGTATTEPAAGINALAWAGDIVAAGGEGGLLSLWRIAGGRPEPLATRTQPRGGTVRSLSFADDGTRLISVGDGQTLAVWNTADPADPRLWGEPIGPAAAGRWFGTLTGDGEAAVISGDNGSLAVVILDPAYADGRIDASSRPLTAEQKTRFGVR